MNIQMLKLLPALVRNARSMKMNRDMIGWELEENATPVKKEEIMQFAKATRDENPAYYGDSAFVPPILVMNRMLPLFMKCWTHKSLGMNILKMVHATQEIKWHRQILPGTPLSIKVKISDIKDTKAGELALLKGEIFQGGERAVEGLAGLIVRNGASAKKDKKSSEPDKELKEKYRLSIQTVEGQQLDYAKASGDYNFIHTSPFLARLAGLPRTIMHGACVLAMGTNALVKKELQNDLKRLSGISGRFSSPVMPGEKLSLAVYESDDKNSVSFEILGGSGKPVFKNGVFRYRL